MTAQIVLQRDGRAQSFNITAAETVLREIQQTQARPLRTLPAAWFEPHVADAMSDWCRNNPDLVTYRNVGAR